MVSIIKQLNKQTGVIYVYESESYWDKEKKQPRSKRKLIGKIDKQTGEIVPTGGRRGRKIKGLTQLPETAYTGEGTLKVLCMEQAEELRRNEEELSALKKQVIELTLSANEYKRRLLKIEELMKT